MSGRRLDGKPRTFPRKVTSEFASLNAQGRCVFDVSDDAKNPIPCGNVLDIPEAELCSRCQQTVVERTLAKREEIVGTKRKDGAATIGSPGMAASRVQRINFRRVGGLVLDY